MTKPLKATSTPGKVMRTMSDQQFEVGERVLEGFAVVYIQRVGNKTVTTSYDKEGKFTSSQRAEFRHIRKATEKNLELARQYDELEKAEHKRRAEYHGKLGELREALE